MKQLFELLYNDIWQWSLQHFLNIFYNTLMSNPMMSNDKIKIYLDLDLIIILNERFMHPIDHTTDINHVLLQTEKSY